MKVCRDKDCIKQIFWGDSNYCENHDKPDQSVPPAMPPPYKPPFTCTADVGRSVATSGLVFLETTDGETYHIARNDLSLSIKPSDVICWDPGCPDLYLVKNYGVSKLTVIKRNEPFETVEPAPAVPVAPPTDQPMYRVCMMHDCKYKANKSSVYCDFHEDSLKPPTIPATTNKPNTGDRRNSGKPAMSIMLEARHAIEGCTRVLEMGAEKYTRGNWRKGLKHSEIADCMIRHLCAYLAGESTDEESGLPHVDHILCNALFLSELTRTRPDLNDIKNN